MRIKGITIAGFGGISDEISVDLNADVVIVVGANGYGKTTICNAISWVICGKSPGSQGPRNLYSKSGTTAVELEADFDGTDVTIARSLENPDEVDVRKLRWPLRVSVGADVLRGADAEVWLRKHLAGTETNEDFSFVVESFMDSIYLQQESLREFLTGRQDTERFDAVASMVGAGRLQEFTDQLQSHKRAWVRALTQSDAALDVDRTKVEDLEASLRVLDGEMAKANAPEVQARWLSWLRDIESLELGELPSTDQLELTEQTLSTIRGALIRARSDVAQQESVMLAAQAELSVPIPAEPNESALTAVSRQIAEVASTKSAADSDVQLLRKALAQSEASLRRAESIREDLATVATILLRHVSEDCSACGQGVDPQVYRARLEGFAADSQDAEQRRAVELERQRLERAEVRSSDAATGLSALADQQQALKQQQASAAAAKERRETRLREVLGRLPDGHTDSARDHEAGLDSIANEIEVLSRRRDLIVHINEIGRQFEAAASLEASRARYGRLTAELAALKTELAKKEQDLVARKQTNEVATALLEAVKKDAESFVAERLTQLRPLLSQFYAAIDPHPTFRSVEIATRQFGGKHRLTPLLRDVDVQVDVANPGETLSTSQANALAVALFLAFNIGFAPTHMNVLVLDDPLQNLDDVHLLGLVDLLRKILPFRQMIITTHDHAFAALLARKLRPVKEGARTTYVRFTKWDRNGPGVEQWDVPAEASPLKLVSANTSNTASS